MAERQILLIFMSSGNTFMGKLLEERGISADQLVPQQKDWNDDLKAEQENKMERSELCQTFC